MMKNAFKLTLILSFLAIIQWYTVERAILPDDICEKLVESNQDEETKMFLDHCYEKSDLLMTQLGHSIAKSVLSWFMTSTSING